MVTRLACLICLAVALSSCEWLLNLQEAEEIPVARFKENYLYKSDVLSSFPQEIHGEDSLTFAQNIIDKWIEEQVMLDRARYNLGDELPELEKNVQDYRNSLFIYSYEKELVRQKLDTVVTRMQIASYYGNYKSTFVLPDHIVKARYAKLDLNSPKMKKVSEWIQSTEFEDAQNLHDYMLQFGLNYSLDDDKWIYLSELLQVLPFSPMDRQAFLSQSNFYELDTAEYKYILYISDYELKGADTPLPIVREKIKSIILNNRKLELIKNTRKNIVNDALSKNQIEFFE